MKLHFEPNLDYQHAAIEAVADLFRGQEINRTEFTVTRRPDNGDQGELGLVENELGIGNRLTLMVWMPPQKGITMCRGDVAVTSQK